MPFSLPQLLAGLLLAVVVAAGAYLARALNRSGAVAAAVLGTIIFGLGGMRWAVLLLAFFISSSLLSRLFGRRKAALDEKFSKGHRRDAGQVLANGGVAGMFVLIGLFFPGAPWVWAGFAGALAAANADTWATELGVLSPSAPWMLTTGQRVERGTSGAVSLTGVAAALAGSALIALLAVLLWPGAPAGHVAQGFTIALAGLAGSLVDSLLGATLQAIYYCPRCAKETERHPLHTCGTTTRRQRGLPWLNNDAVNTACTISGAVLAALL